MVGNKLPPSHAPSTLSCWGWRPPKPVPPGGHGGRHGFNKRRLTKGYKRRSASFHHDSVHSGISSVVLRLHSNYYAAHTRTKECPSYQKPFPERAGPRSKIPSVRGHKAADSPSPAASRTCDACPTSLPAVRWRSPAGSFTCWDGARVTEVCRHLLRNRGVLRLRSVHGAYESREKSIYHQLCQVFSEYS